MKKQILILALTAISSIACAQTQPKDTAKVVVPQLSEETLARMKAAEEEQRVADSIAIAKYTKKFVDSIPEKDLKLITGPNMKVEYVKPTPQKKPAPKRKPTSKKSN
jgi:hypothetical protein